MGILTPGDITTNGINLHYSRTENRSSARPSLVLLHGLTDSGLCWPRVVKALAPEYDMILPDARGHGLSDKPATGYAPSDHAADVAGLIRGLGLIRPILIGHSMGAGVSATVAALYPDLVSAVILEDPPWRAEGDEERPRSRQPGPWRGAKRYWIDKPCRGRSSSRSGSESSQSGPTRSSPVGSWRSSRLAPR